MDKYLALKQARTNAEKLERYSDICLHCLDEVHAAHYYMNGMRGTWQSINTTAIEKALELFKKYLDKKRIADRYVHHCFIEWMNDKI